VQNRVSVKKLPDFFFFFLRHLGVAGAPACPLYLGH
jgi:hypothetical protein